MFVRRPLLVLAVLAVAFAAIVAPDARAQLATGGWTAAYGAPLAVQAVQSTGKYPMGGRTDYSNSYELDGAYGYISGGALHLLLTGNIPLWWNIEGQPFWLPVDMFLDTRAGGQNVLLANNPAPVPGAYDLATMAGLKFDADFAPDWWFSTGGTYAGYGRIGAVMAELPTAGGGAGADLGWVACNTSAALAGGTNPFGVSVAVNDTNTAGVAHGCGASAGAEIRSGIEWVIPLAAIGNPQGCVRACVFDLAAEDHSRLANQVLGALPQGTCDLGAPATVDFSAIPGAQWFQICPAGGTATRRATWGALKSIYR